MYYIHFKPQNWLKFTDIRSVAVQKIITLFCVLKQHLDFDTN